MEKSLKRIPSLDGLRAISIALVVIGHWLHVLDIGQSSNLGNLGVRVFFVISGFLITGLLLREIEKTATVNLPKFYFRRTLRIFPAYYFYLLLISAAILFGWISIPLKSLFFASFYLTDYINPSNWYLGHTWSLAVEEQFYLIFPGVLLLLGLRRTKFLLLFLIAFSPLVRFADYEIFGAEPIWVVKGFHANMDALGIGCLLALFYKRLHQNTLYRKLLKSKAIILMPAIIIFLNFQWEHPIFFLVACFSLMNILTAICIDWAVTNYETVFGRFLNSSLMIKLGMMSYSIYLWQQPFFNPENTSILTQTPFNFIGLALMTLISYYCVERYSLKVRQNIENKLFRDNLSSEKNQLWHEKTQIF